MLPVTIDLDKFADQPDILYLQFRHCFHGCTVPERHVKLHDADQFIEFPAMFEV